MTGVINDEARHAWRVPPKSTIKGVAKEELEEATKWVAVSIVSTEPAASKPVSISLPLPSPPRASAAVKKLSSDE